MSFKTLILLCLYAISSLGLAEACLLTLARFRTNNLRNPLAIASSRPVFSWAIELIRPYGSDELPKEELGVDHFQSAYRLTCHDMDTGELLWDTDMRGSSETLQIEYEGVPLRSLQRVQWYVQFWDDDGNQCPHTQEEPWFETGLLDDQAWGGAEWIARFDSLPPEANLCSMMAETDENQVPRFRVTIDAFPEAIVRARAYIAGLGYYQLYINGQRVGDSLLDTAWTTYSKRVLYASHDVTSLLVPTDAIAASNRTTVVGVELGNGWWNPLPILMFQHINLRIPLLAAQNITSSRPMFRLRLVGFRADGSVVTLLQSTSGPLSPWTTSGSPTTFNNIYLGEKYDARLEPAFDHWSTPSYEGSTAVGWHATVNGDSSGLGKLQAQELPPIRRQKSLVSTLLAVRTNSTGHSLGIIDTGINHAGSCRIRVRQVGAAAVGKTIGFKYGELLDPDGSVNALTAVAGHIVNKNPQEPCQPAVAYQQDFLTVGSRPVDWTPAWSWHGFRYIEVTVPPLVSMDDISIDCFTMRSDVDVVANFSTSQPWISEVRQLIQNTFDSNLMGVQSDCPHRERFGYGGDALGCGEAGMSLYDFSAFYRKRLLDYNDAQIILPSGRLAGFTETSPFVGIQTSGLGPGMGPIGWEAYQPEAQLWLYKYYGDSRTMRESFNHTSAYISLLDSEPVAIEKGLGDWLAVDRTDVAFTGRGFQYMSYLAFANITEILGMPSDTAVLYRRKASLIADQINSRFMDASGIYRVGIGNGKNHSTQTGQGMALFNGFLSNHQKTKENALGELVANARASSYLEGACQDQTKIIPECDTAQGGPGAHLTTGLFGMKWVLMALADGDMNDLAYEMVASTTYPGLRWMMNNPFANATTIWESFFFSGVSKSHNHPMFSSVEVWLLQSVAGIQPHPSAFGMDHVLIKPKPPSQIDHVAASFESPRGVISVSWKRNTDEGVSRFGLNVTIPPNCRATIHIPAKRYSEIWYNRALLLGVAWEPSISNVAYGSYSLQVGSGRHELQSICRVKEADFA